MPLSSREQVLLGALAGNQAYAKKTLPSVTVCAPDKCRREPARLASGRKRFHAAVAVCLLLRFAAPLPCLGQMRQSKSVQDASGRTMTNATLWAVTAAGQSVTGRNRSADNRFAIVSGFLAAVLLQPWLDTDGDGLCDELDWDNDGDGVIDEHELIADTDPNDPSSVLVFLEIGPDTDGVRLEWQGGRQARQVLWRRDAMTDGDWTPLITNSPPTPVVTNFLDRTAAGSAAYYRLTADRPDE